VRVDGGAGSLAEPRVFLSDRRAVVNSDVAAMLWEDADEEPATTTTTRAPGPIAEPVGDTALLADLGHVRRRTCSTCARRRACSRPTC
jgi:hypothetical protein